MGKNNSKTAYQLVKDLTTVKQEKLTTVQDCSGKCLTEEREILNQLTEHCTKLYNHKANGGSSEDDHHILRIEVEVAVQLLNKGKSAGVDIMPADLVQAGERGCNDRSHDKFSFFS